MEFLSTLSNDEIALLGCAIALLSTGTLMCLSYYIGRMRTSEARVSASSSQIPALAKAPAAASSRRNAA